MKSISFFGMNQPRGKIFSICAFFFCLSFLYAEDFSSVNDSEARSRFITHSKTYLGTPYRYGGMSKAGVDCSGFIYIAAQESVHLQLPRTVASLYTFADQIPEAARQPGDLVFFNTVGTKASHVGIYLGEGLFIHSASDGPKTGVIISSLDETYWKKNYMSSGRFMKAGTEEFASVSGGSVARTNTGSGLLHLDLELSGSVVWNFLPGHGFFFNTRGGSVRTGAVYTRWAIQPGLSAELRFDPDMHITQLPLLVSLSFKNIRLYAGPVFTFGTPIVPGSGEEVSPSVFPGIIGLSWQTPQFKVKQFGFSLYQDVSYTFFNSAAEGSLPFADSITSGLLFTTGLRFSFSL